MRDEIQKLYRHPVIISETKIPTDMEVIIWQNQNIWRWKIAIRGHKHIMAQSENGFVSGLDCTNDASFTIKKLSRQIYSIGI